MRQLDKLLEIAAIENKLIKHEIEFYGIDLTFWCKPTKIDELIAAKKASKNSEELIEVSARLFIQKACDESGNPQYGVDAYPILMKALSLKTASKLIGMMEKNKEEEEGEELDLKSFEEPAKKGENAAV